MSSVDALNELLLRREVLSDEDVEMAVVTILL
jgi:hypothetical protein